jgi:hypothetical protein
VELRAYAFDPEAESMLAAKAGGVNEFRVGKCQTA